MTPDVVCGLLNIWVDPQKESLAHRMQSEPVVCGLRGRKLWTSAQTGPHNSRVSEDVNANQAIATLRCLPGPCSYDQNLLR